MPAHIGCICMIWPSQKGVDEFCKLSPPMQASILIALIFIPIKRKNAWGKRECML